MEVFITNELYILFETVELLRAFVNGTAPEELTMEGEFCLSPQEVAALMEDACGDVDPADAWVQYFFKEFPILDDSNQKTCLASCMSYSIFNVRMLETGLEQQLAFVVEKWNQLRRSGYRFSGVNRFGIGIDPAPSQEPVRLADELKQLPLASEHYLLLHEVFSDLAFSVERLLPILRPVAERLSTLLRPYARRAALLTERWFRFLKDREMLRAFLLHRSGTTEEAIDQVYLALRYLHCRYAVGTAAPEDHSVGFHLGVGVRPTLTPGYQEGTKASREREFAAFKLLGDKGRQDIIRLLSQESMTIQEVANRLEINSGTVFRNINSLFNAELLMRENHGGRFLYRARLAYIETIFDHMLMFFRKEAIPGEEQEPDGGC
ncbi:MAG: winged helix-turn-helix transcriptional regulator [Oscillospiraceae bacterium]|nr:winged helix-turn-helix transcriptional regulator [Oscillospiraceae bacterium]